MKRSFYLGVLAGCVFSALIFIGYYATTNCFPKGNVVSIEVQKQIIQNIQDVTKLLVFADDNLKEYTDNLQEAREILLKADDGKYLDQEGKRKITSLSNKGLQIIETATFNTIPVFLGNCDGEYSRIIPVTLDATKPSYKLNISCIEFNRNVINTFIKNLTPEMGLEKNISELDKIITAVSLERAQLSAYQNKLTYSLETATALTKNNLNDRQMEINRIIRKIKTEQLVLSVQSANGIYCSEDRQQIQLNFDELNNELNRISGFSRKSIVPNNGISVLSQSDAENAMLCLVKK